MKKRLITSLILTLVIVLSMSTATFAWYTASTKATADLATITANSADSNLLISKEENGTYGKAISFEAVEEVDPLAPIVAYNNDVATFIAADNWTTGTAKIDENGAETYTLATGGAVTKYEFFIANQAVDAINVAVEVTAGAGTTSDHYNYLVIAGTQVVATKGEYNLSVSDGADSYVKGTTGNNTANATISNVGATPVKITVIAWFDGWTHKNVDAGEVIELDLTFTKAA